MKKIAILSLMVGILLATANVSYARDGSKIPKTEVIPKSELKAPEQAPIVINVNLAVAPDAIVVDVSPTKNYAVYATSNADASSLVVQERLSPAEVPRLWVRHWHTNLPIATTNKHIAPPLTPKIKDRRSNTFNTEGYQVKKE